MVNLSAGAIEKQSKEREAEIGLVQGIMPDSVNEWYFALACDKLGLTYNFQFMVGGGERGSQWVDFLVLTATGWAACYIQGAYWHNYRTESEDKLKQQIARHLFGDSNVFEFSEEETESVEAAIKSITKKLAV